MEPTLPTPVQPEGYPARPLEAQQGVSQYVNPEASGVGSAEKIGEMHPISSSQAVSSQQQISVQSAAAPQPVVPAPAQAPQSSAAPLIADDVDVIEKEWVDKAKKIVGATKEDPYMQEQQVSALQADYLMKRYNKKIKLAE